MNVEALLQIETRPPAPPKLRDWYAQVAKLGCLITKSPEPTLHHIHSGSCGDIGLHSGMSQRGIHPYLVIPLRADLHCIGSQGIDSGCGVRTWETQFGSQVELMDEVCELTGVNAWAIAGIERNPWSRSKRNIA